MVKAWQIAMGECVVALVPNSLSSGATYIIHLCWILHKIFFFALYNYIYVSIDIMEGMEGSVCFYCPTQFHYIFNNNFIQFYTSLSQMDSQQEKLQCSLLTSDFSKHCSLFLRPIRTTHQLSLLDLTIVSEAPRMCGNYSFLQQEVNIFLAIV